MESPNCAVAVQSASFRPLPVSSTTQTGREYNENSLNAALACHLYTNNTPRNVSSNVLRNDYGRRPFSMSLPPTIRSRPLSDILDEAIKISDVILLHDSINYPREVSSLQQQQ